MDFYGTENHIISSDNELKITVSPTYHSLHKQVGDTVIFLKKEFRELKVLKYDPNKLY